MELQENDATTQTINAKEQGNVDIERLLRMVDKSRTGPPNILFYVQVISAALVIVAALICLILFPNFHHDFWIATLGTAIGYLLPSPSIQRK